MLLPTDSLTPFIVAYESGIASEFFSVSLYDVFGMA